MCVTDSGIVMLAKDRHPSKARSPMAFTDSGIAALTTWWHSLKALAGIAVREKGMLTWRKPFTWIASFAAASTSFREYMTVASDSACNIPTDSNVWSSSTSNPSARTFTLRILCSMGSSQCFFSCSIAFNSLMVVFGTTSTVRSPPCRVFNFSSWGMAAMAARKNSTRNCSFNQIRLFK